MQKVRRYVEYVEKILSEGGKPAEKPIQMIAPAAVIANPCTVLRFRSESEAKDHGQCAGLGRGFDEPHPGAGRIKRSYSRLMEKSPLLARTVR